MALGGGYKPKKQGGFNIIIKTILNFTGLYAALQFCLITIVQVFNIDVPSGAMIGLTIAAAHGSMMASVSAFGRAPTLSENWILSVSVNLCATAISLVSLTATLYFTDGIYALEEFMMLLSALPLAVFFIGVIGAFVLLVVICLLVFGKAARRHLLKVQAEDSKVLG